jgi:hypothetical protein
MLEALKATISTVPVTFLLLSCSSSSWLELERSRFSPLDLNIISIKTENFDPGCLSRIRIFPSWIQDPHKRIEVFYPQKIVSKLSVIRSRLFIPDPDPDFLPIPDPGVKKAPDPGSAAPVDP